MCPHPDTEEWDFNPVGMLRVHQAHPYHLGQCIADLIDNSYDALATKIDVSISLTEEGRMYVLILDNGNGIPKDQWKKVMTLGLWRKRGKTDLGVYGVGLKLSSLSQANEVTVASVNNGDFGLRRLSANHIRSTGINEVLKFPISDSQTYREARQRMIDEGWSTMVLLEDMHAEDRIVSLDSTKVASFEKEIKKIRTHLGITFDRVIKSEERGHVDLKFQTKTLKPIDPFMAWEDDPKFGTVSQLTTPIAFKSNSRNIVANVTPYIIPHDKRSQDKPRRNLVNKGYYKANDMQGLYVYRNNRLIQYGGWSSLKGTNDEHDKLGKIRIDMPEGAEEIFGLSPTKTDIQLPMEFLRKLRHYLDESRQWGQINKGKPTSFFDAADVRYRNEGKGAPKRKNQTSKESDSGLFNPDSKSKNRRKVKPNTSVVRSIESDGDTTTVIIDNTAEKAQNLMEEIRRWKGA
jgi:ribosomal protein L28